MKNIFMQLKRMRVKEGRKDIRIMIKKTELHLEDIIEAEDNLEIAAAGLLSEIRKTGIESSSEIVKKYYENFERMSLLIKNYADFLIEDTGRIYQAALSILEPDGRMIS